MSIVTQSIGQYQSWTPTFTGFSADPSTITSRYTLNGKKCTIWFTANANGTSNATTFTMTLPFAASAAAVQIAGIRVTNSGTIQADSGMIRTQVNSNIADIFLTFASGAFTASGAKSCAIAGFTYEIA